MDDGADLRDRLLFGLDGYTEAAILPAVFAASGAQSSAHYAGLLAPACHKMPSPPSQRERER